MKKILLLTIITFLAKSLHADLVTYVLAATKNKNKDDAIKVLSLMKATNDKQFDYARKSVAKNFFNSDEQATLKALPQLGGAAPAMPVSPKFQDIKDAAGATKAMADLFEKQDGSGAMAVQAITAAAGKTGADKRSQAIAAAIKSNLQN